MTTADMPEHIQALINETAQSRQRLQALERQLKPDREGLQARIGPEAMALLKVAAETSAHAMLDAAAPAAPKPKARHAYV